MTPAPVSGSAATKLGGVLLALAWSAAPDLAAAQAKPAPKARVPTVSGVTVVARRPLEGIDVTGDFCPKRPRGTAAGAPRVVASSPREGEVVPGGAVTLSLTFDQPMNCGWAVAYRDAFCTELGEWDMPARRTWSMRCVFPPGERWELEFNEVNGYGFKGLAGLPASRFRLGFSTGPLAETPVIPAAEARAGRVGRLVCPDVRRRGRGPRCRYLAEVDETATGS